jgi:N-acetylmuramoyl-L-alanine amidase
MKRAILILAATLGSATASAAEASRSSLAASAWPGVRVETGGSREEPEDTTSARRSRGAFLIALQAGHWRAHEAPAEQSHLRQNGTRAAGRYEWEVNLDIALRTARILEQTGYAVEILPTTIPPGYRADLFISIHADGHPSSAVSGFRAAGSRWDVTSRAADFARLLERSYAESTRLPHYPTLTNRMTGYYAFNSYWYTHALDPMTTAVILETGFLTSPWDRRVIVDAPELAARGIADAVRLYLATALLEPSLAPAPPPAHPLPRPGSSR